MQQIGSDLWVHEDAMTLAGVRLGLRMTIVKLSDGGVWIHSPTALSPQLKAEVDAIGPVTAIVAASNNHSLWLQDWCEAYPKAEAYVSAGIPRSVPLSNYHILQPGLDNPWPEDFTWATMPGVPAFNETVFFHHKTRSLIVTDLIQNHPETTPPGFAGFVSKYVFQPIGFKGICVAPPLKLGIIRKDKSGFADFIRTVGSWDFSRIIVTHGDIIDDNAKSIFSELSLRFTR
ncbi:DUF4336 domain-containing protein [Photobacterium atrarenae]|uniref:DUF4336 domain-containing protein n=1 Tax=Photobacterium atrarenae TaxID=865757 RepID=A0ABY5GKZ0_9GAMM|nr:DUF4336 domain-containing protein [Photobacterium atrarenae]UTV29441.1 DUF4336 domain-containing protein [Photobacterium atrarenae]